MPRSAEEGRNPRETSRETDRDEANNPRKRRVPLGSIRSKLTAEAREGYHRLWVNDYPEGHLNEALDAGYEFVRNDIKIGDFGDLLGNDLGSMRSQIVGTKPDGSPMRGYLMEIRQDWHDEDMAENVKRAQEIDDQIASGAAGDQGNEYDTDNRYVPGGGESPVKYHPGG